MRQTDARQRAAAANASTGQDLPATNDAQSTGDVEMGNTGQQANGSLPTPNVPRQPWEYVEETTAILKTAFPLLALTLETIGDQIQLRFKPTSDEDVCRIISALSSDAMQVRSCVLKLICC